MSANVKEIPTISKAAKKSFMAEIGFFPVTKRDLRVGGSTNRSIRSIDDKRKSPKK